MCMDLKERAIQYDDCAHAAPVRGSHALRSALRLSADRRAALDGRGCGGYGGNDVHVPIMMGTNASARDLWARILREGENAASREHVLARLIADCVSSRASLADAVCSRIASLL